MNNSDPNPNDLTDEALAELGLASEPGDPSLSGMSEMEQLRQQLSEAENKALRYQADMDNFRRRNRKETEEQLRYAALPLMSDLLEAVDNLERAIQSSQSNPGDQGSQWLDGVKMVAQQLNGVLSQYGCQPIDSVGQKFDPKLHQAVQQVADPQVPADHVIHDLRPGYRLHERVIRPAQVVVSTGPLPG